MVAIASAEGEKTLFWAKPEFPRKLEISSSIRFLPKKGLLTGITLTLHKSQVHCSSIMQW